MQRNATSTMVPRLGSLSDVSDITGFDPRTIRRYIAAGKIRAFRVGPRAIRIDMDSVNDLLRPIGPA